MAGFTLARIALDSPVTWSESWGDPVTNTGGAPVPAIRTAIRHSVDLPTFTDPLSEDGVARRLRARRQLRAMLNNAPYKMSGLFLSWEDDPEQEGWYIPDQGQVIAGADSPLTHGWWNLANFAWFKIGAPRTHRGAALLSVKDLRTGLTARDTLRRVYSTDFSGLSALALTYLPAGVSDVANTASLEAVPVILLPVGWQGGQTGLVTGQVDLTVLAYEQSMAGRNLGDVVVYDQREQSGLPTLGEDPQDFGWEEIYGPDYPYTAGSVPVLQNGLCRVRYDSTNTPGFRVDVWTGSEWEEQGKINISRYGGTAAYDSQLLSASVREYTPDRAVVEVVMRNPADPASREAIFITLQRGWSGPRIEVYPAPNAAGEKMDAIITVTLATADTDDSAIKIDAGSVAAISATAMGTGHTGLWDAATIGATTFTGENELIIGRWKSTSEVTPFCMTLAVVQAALMAIAESAETAAYGVTRNAVSVLTYSTKLGYCSVQFGFPAQKADQVMEAESMTLGTGTAATADAESSGGKAATATRTTDANPHVTKATWPNGKWGTYRVFAHAKTSVGSSKLKLYAKTSGTTGATKETASTTNAWIDLGMIFANNSTLEIHAWLSAAGTLSVDRIEAFLIEDRQTAHGGTFQGGRDLGESVLMDSRVRSTVVVR